MSFITLIKRVFMAKNEQDDEEIFVHLGRLITRGDELYGSLNIQREMEEIKEKLERVAL